VKESRAEAPCPVKGCSGKAVRLSSKKDGRAFWKCPKCGKFFDDAEGKPVIREKKGKNDRTNKKQQFGLRAQPALVIGGAVYQYDNQKEISR
jgi:uncharacterized C2H2 Zn-finger protein